MAVLGAGGALVGLFGAALLLPMGLYGGYYLAREVSPLGRGARVCARYAAESPRARVSGVVFPDGEALVAPNGERAVAFELRDERERPLRFWYLQRWVTQRVERRAAKAAVGDATGECTIDLSGDQWRLFAEEWEQRPGPGTRRRLVVLRVCARATAVGYTSWGQGGRHQLSAHESLAGGIGFDGPFVVTRRWLWEDRALRLLLFALILIATVAGPSVLLTGL